MDRMTKEASVEELKSIFSSGSVVIAHYTGMTVAEMTDLRTRLRATGGTFKVVRNRLAKIALSGKASESASEYFNGPVGIAFSEDFTAAPKAAVDYAKGNEKFQILGGFMEEEVFDAKGVEALSRMPSREELIATVAARLLGQAGEIVSRINSPAQTLAGQIQVIGEKAEA